MSSTASQQGLLRKVPVAVSTPAAVQASSSSGPKANSAVLKPTAPEAATSSVTDNEVRDSTLHTQSPFASTSQLSKWHRYFQNNTDYDECSPLFLRCQQLWSEMRRHQILREELRQRRKHLESLMAEHQRRSGVIDSPRQTDDQEGLATPSQSVSRDER